MESLRQLTFDENPLTTQSHCPWVDTCVGVNNHKHFLLYVISLIIGIALLIWLTFACTSCPSTDHSDRRLDTNVTQTSDNSQHQHQPISTAKSSAPTSAPNGPKTPSPS